MAKKWSLKALASWNMPLRRERLDHLLAFVDARSLLRTPGNVLLDAFYWSKESVKRQVGWKPRGRPQLPRVARQVHVRPTDLDYTAWVVDTEPGPGGINILRQLAPILPSRPLISVLMPTHNTPLGFLREAIESVRQQVYPHWELCIADDASTDPKVLELLKSFASLDPRIKLAFRETNGHISQSSNTALALATGEYVALLDHDDLLAPDALFHVAQLIRERPQLDMIYSDEDKLSEENERHSPYFKPDWAPETFLSRMYTCHLGVYRTSIARRIGGFRQGFEGSQDYDFVLRFTEETRRIAHIPRVLYHWRVHSASTALTAAAKPYAYVAAKKALNEAMGRRHQPGTVTDVLGFLGHYRVRFQVTGRPRVCIVVPTRDFADVLEKCLSSLFSFTRYPNFEVVIVDNGSVRPETKKLFERWAAARPAQLKVVRHDAPFNFSQLCNLGAAQTDAEFVLFLNNDTEIIEPGWLEDLLGYAQQPEIGAVGAKLLYGNFQIQHVGVVIGLGGAAGHPHQYEPRSSAGYFGSALGCSNVSAVTAACLLVERTKFQAVGGFDEALPITYNDVDLCLRLLQKGFRNVVVADVEVMHHESATRGYDITPEKRARLEKEAGVLRERWSNLFWRDPFYSPNLTHVSSKYVTAHRHERLPRDELWGSHVYDLSEVGCPGLRSGDAEPARLAQAARTA